MRAVHRSLHKRPVMPLALILALLAVSGCDPFFGAQHSAGLTGTPSPTACRPAAIQPHTGSAAPPQGRIAFATGDPFQIWVMNADGSDRRQLTHAHGPVFSPAWSPDGAAIAYDTQRDFATLTDTGAGPEFEIHVMNADGSCDTRITNNALEDRFPVWSPDGAYLVWTQQGEVTMMSAHGGDPTSLGSGHFPAWRR